MIRALVTVVGVPFRPEVALRSLQVVRSICDEGRCRDTTKELGI